MKKYNIVVIGATGNVGSETLNILAERNFPINNMYAIASHSSLGRDVSFGDKRLKIDSLDDFDFSKVHIAFFSAGSEASKKYIPIATNNGCVVIDKSSFFRYDSEVPLIVPEANLADLKNYTRKNIIANPNCCTIPLAVALKPLDNAAKIDRIVISTYQSTSGAGRAGMDELYNQTKAKYIFDEVSPQVFPRPIAFNLVPHIGNFNEDGSTTEESKIALELKKIIGNHVKPTITCVRVPVFIGHSMSVNIEFENEINAMEAQEILQESDGVSMISKSSAQKYSTPMECVGADYVYVSRIRDDHTKKNTINLWITTDNLRKGAALNAVQIAEELRGLL
jgi:aspartate-semialdehyde dehydrogenase